jgi:hypothetical protein
MYTLAGENDEVRGWGRVGETERVSARWDLGVRLLPATDHEVET